MALQKEIISKTGFNAINAYGRVVDVHYTRDRTKAILYWFKDASIADSAAKISQDTVEFAADINGQNLVAQAYEAFKKLKHVSGAKDV